MPTEDNSNQEVFPPSPIERVMWGAEDVTDEMRDAVQQSYLWTGMDDEERQKAIQCVIAMTVINKRGFNEWLVIGEGVLLFQTEVKNQSNSTSIKGKRYNAFWKAIVPAPVKQLKRADRSSAINLWEARDAITPWYEGLKDEQRQRWTHPTTILRHYELAKRVAANYPLPLDDDETPRRHPPDTRSRRAAAAAIVEATQQVHHATEDLREVVRDVREVTGTPERQFDLSTAELAYTSADNFRSIYGASYGDEALQQFTEALRDVNPEWVAGKDWWNDEISEVSQYYYQRDPERAVKIAKDILRRHRAQRRRDPPS